MCVFSSSMLCMYDMIYTYTIFLSLIHNYIYINRISFNIAFKNSGINEEWSEERYGKLLETGGGKERMTAHWVSDHNLSMSH